MARPASSTSTGGGRGQRLLLLGLRAEARNDLDRAAALYERVAAALDGDTPPGLVRASLRRGAAVALKRGEPSRASSYLRRHLELSAELPPQTLALAEHQLVESLVLAGRRDEARSILGSSKVSPEELPQLDRLARLSARIELGVDQDPQQLVALVEAGDLPLESAVHTLLTAANERELAAAGPTYDALAVVIGRASAADVSAIGGKGLARCAGRYERAGRFAAAAACWRLIWLHRRERRGESNPKTLAAHGQVARLSSLESRSAERGARARVWKRWLER